MGFDVEQVDLKDWKAGQWSREMDVRRLALAKIGTEPVEGQKSSCWTTLTSYGSLCKVNGYEVVAVGQLVTPWRRSREHRHDLLPLGLSHGALGLGGGDAALFERQ